MGRFAGVFGLVFFFCGEAEIVHGLVNGFVHIKFMFFNIFFQQFFAFVLPLILLLIHHIFIICFCKFLTQSSQITTTIHVTGVEEVNDIINVVGRFVLLVICLRLCIFILFSSTRHIHLKLTSRHSIYFCCFSFQ